MSQLFQAAKAFVQTCVQRIGSGGAEQPCARAILPEPRKRKTGAARLAWAPVALLAAGAALAPQTALAQSAACQSINNGEIGAGAGNNAPGTLSGTYSIGVASPSTDQLSSTNWANFAKTFTPGEVITFSWTRNSGNGYVDAILVDSNFMTRAGSIQNRTGASGSTTITVGGATDQLNIAVLNYQIDNDAGFTGNGEVGHDNSSYTFTVSCASAPTPTVTAVSPTAGPTGGANSVTITGTNFTGTTGAAGVKFGATNASSYTVNSSTQITAIAPAGAAATVNITVTNGGNTSATSGASQYTYVAAPTVTGRSPSSGPAAGGTSVTITGTGFLTADPTGAVKFGASNATYTINSNTQITATSPANSAGTYDITVNTPGGTSATSANDQFTYVAAPTVTSLSPTSGPTGGTTSVVITGTNFTGTTGAAGVKFGATNASSYTVNSNTQITAVAPAGSAGTVNVTVTNGGITSATGAANQYSYVAAPVSSSQTYGSIIAYNDGSNATTNLDLSNYLTGGGTPTSYAVGSATTAQGGSVSVNSSGIATYTPPVGYRNGNDSFVWSATNTGGTSSFATLTVTIGNPTLSVTLPSGTATTGTAYNAGASAVTVSGGRAAYTINSISGLPTGLSDAGGGVISGTPSATGTFTVTVNITDSSIGAGPYTANATASLVVSAPPSPVASSFTASAVAYDSTNNSISLAGHATNSPTTYAVGSATTAQGGSVSVDSSGLVTYTAPTGFRGNDSFTFTATNPSGTSAPATVTVPVSNPTLTISLSGSGTRGTALSGVAISTSGGRATYSCSTTVASGSLPSGVSLNADCSLSGTPAASGNFNFTVTVTDSSLGTGPFTTSSGTLTLAIAAPTLTLTPASGALPGATAGASYSQSFTAGGGTATYSYARTSGTLPTGLALSGNTLSGTPTAVGTFNFDITATDSATVGSGGPYTTTRSYSVTVSQPVITLSALSGGTVGTAYTPSVTASGGTASYSYSVTSGSLPAGVSLSASGAFSGTPTAGGSFNFTVTATDSTTGPAAPYSGSQAYTVTFATPTVTLSPSSLTDATAGTAYSASITASGGTGGYTYAITSGSLPAGLSLSGSGALSGTPTAAGSFTFTVTATDSSTGTGAPYSGSRPYTLTVAAPTISVSPSTLPNGRAGTAYSQTVTASGGVGTYSYAVTAGALPPGWSLSSSGVISGTATASDTYAFTITATDSATGTGAPFTGSRGYSVSVQSPNFSLTPPTLSASVGQAYSGNFVAGGGTAPYTYSRTAGTLPAGLTLASDGTLSGTPTAGGTYNFTIIARDSTTGAGAPYGVGSNYNFTVGAATLSLAPSTLSNGTVGSAYSASVTASGGTAPYAYQVTAGALPAGLTLSTGGVLSGTPTAGGGFNFTITATDSSTGTGAPFSVSQAYGLTINAPTLTLNPASLPDGAYGVAYSQTVGASGGTAPYAYQVTSGALPAGLTLSSGGTLSGTPTVFGSFNVSVTATDSSTGSGPFTGTQTYVLTVANPAAPTVAAVSANVAYNSTGQAISLSPSGVYTTLSVGAAPAHGAVSISGTTATYMPTSGYYGADSFTYTATGPGGTSSPATVTITVGNPPAPVAANLGGVAVAYDSTGQAIDLSGSVTGVHSGVSVGTAPAHGTTTVVGDVVTYVPASSYFGADSFTYTATGPGGTSSPATVSLTVATPAAPTVAAVSANVAYNSTGQAISLSPSGVYSALSVGTAPAHGTVSISGTTATYVPTSGYFGADNFTYTATGPGGTSSPATVSLTVATPAAPTVAAASANVAYNSTGQAISLSPSGVYSTLSVGTAPAHGTVSISGTTATYVPAEDYFGADSFTYTATGPGGTSSPATVSLTVATPAAPTVAAASANVAYNSTGQAISLSPSGVYSTLSVGTAPAHGTVSISGTTATYTPTSGYFGADSFTYTATGPGGTSSPATVSLTVATPAAPTVAAASANVAYNSTGQAISLSPSGVYSTLSVGTAPAHGTVSISGTTATYAPTSGYFGADSFTYTATGPGGTSSPATVSLTVATPAAPTVAAASANVAYNSTGQAISLSPSGVYSTLSVGTAPAHGTVSISGTTATYVPTTGYFGADSFTYTATGPGGTSSPATVSLTVATPAAPTVAGASANVAYNSTGQAISLSPSGVYSTLSVGTAPAHGTVSISGTTATYVPAEDYFGADSFTYVATGPGGTSSPATVSLTVAAPPPPVVTPPPPATVSPTTPGGSVSVDLPTTTSGEVTGYRITVNAGHGSAEIETVSSGGLGGVLQASAMPIYRLKYTPAANFMGTDTVTLVATGPGGDSAPAVFTFQVPGKAPDLTVQVVSNTSVTIRPTQTLTGGPFQGLRITRQPAFGTATVQGLTIVFTPGVSNGGATSLDYVVDLSFGSSAAGRIDLTSNAAPSAQVLTARTPAGRPVTVRISDGAIGGPFAGATVTGITPAGSATATLVQGGTTAAPTWDLTVTPQGTFTGNTVIGFTLTNAFATTAGTLTVTVDPRPDPALDPDVRGVVSSQVESARRFADAQTDNFNRRLEQIRQGGNGDSNMLSVNAGFAMDGSQGDPNAQFRQRLGGVRQAFGDEGLRARLGLLDDDRSNLFGRDRTVAPVGGAEPSDRLNAAPASAGGGGRGPSDIGVWAAGGIDWGRRDADTGARDYRFSTSGVSAGSDMRINDDLVIGIGAGYGFDRTKVGDAGSRSEGRSVVVAAYGGWRLSPSLNLDGVLGYGDLDYDSRRWATAASAGSGAYAFGERKGDMTFGSLSLVWDQKQGGANRSVYGRLQAQSVTLDGFTETGADIYALTYDALDFDSLSSSLGLRYDWRIEQRNGYFRPAVRLEWTHAFDHAGPQTVAYADWLASPRYGVALEGWDRDTLEVGLEGGWKIGDRLDLAILYRAAMGEDTASMGLQFKLASRF